jgi:hypothetical protein
MIGRTQGICVWSLLAGSVAIGCSAGPGGQGPQSTSLEKVDTTEEALTVSTFHWSQGSGPTVMWSKNSGYCFLTGVTGHFVGGGEAVYVTMDSTNSTWILTGRSGQQGISGTAMCASWSSLGANAPSWTWNNWVVDTTQTWETEDMWGTDSFCHLGGVAGYFGSASQMADVEPGDSSDPNWNVTAYHGGANIGNDTEADGQCVALRQKHGVGLTQRFFWQQGSSAVYLGPMSNRLCALETVQGHFQGSGESVQITQDGTNWFLSGTSQQTGVAAEALCVTIP